MCTQEYEVGVKVLNTRTQGSNAGKTGVVEYVCGDSVYIRYDDGSLGNSDEPARYYKIVGKVSINNNASNNNSMNNIVKFAKGLTLSADEKLLRKFGLKDENGQITCAGKEIILEKLFADNESILIDIAKAKKTEDKEDK